MKNKLDNNPELGWQNERLHCRDAQVHLLDPKKNNGNDDVMKLRVTSSRALTSQAASLIGCCSQTDAHTQPSVKQSTQITTNKTTKLLIKSLPKDEFS